MTPENQDTAFFNGVNGATGAYLLPPMTAEEISAVAQGDPLPAEWFRQNIEWWNEYVSEAHLGSIAGVDPKNLAETGWAVVFAHDADPAVQEALRPLLDHRREQATRHDERYYRELTGPDGLRPGESKQKFLSRHGAALGNPADPSILPYYLLLVGSPAAIPFDLQYQLDVEYAVGRIDFETPDEYESYARSVVAAESGEVRRPRTATFFGVRNPGDRATELSHDHLVKPLAAALAESPAGEHDGWRIETVLAEDATKARLITLLDDAPSLLFTASHGVGFPKDHERQRRHQGAVLCQDWPGRGKAKPDVYLAGDDVSGDARLQGLISFHFACYGAGTPRLDSFAHRAFRNQPLGDQARRRRAEIAPQDFVAQLPQRLLGHPRGGALAVVGHVERAWTYSFYWQAGQQLRAGQQLQAYQSTLEQLLEGHPVGSAMEFFNQRYAALSAELFKEHEDRCYGKTPDPTTTACLWTANNDARSFVVLGDPAVRLCS